MKTTSFGEAKASVVPALILLLFGPSLPATPGRPPLFGQPLIQHADPRAYRRLLGVRPSTT